MLGRGHDLIVNIVGETSGLQRAYGTAQRQTTTFTNTSQRAGQRLSRTGVFAMSAASALGLQTQVGSTAETIVGHFGVGGDAQTAVGGLATTVADLGLESQTAAKLLGKAGLAGAAGYASFQLASAALEATGLDKKLEGLGGTAYNTAARLGLVHDPMAQYKGKPILGQNASRFLRNQARAMIAGGATAQQAADRILATHPNVARRDAESLAGVYAPRPIVVQSDVYLDGKKVAQSTTVHQQRAQSHAARQTSGRHG